MEPYVEAKGFNIAKSARSLFSTLNVTKCWRREQQSDEEKAYPPWQGHAGDSWGAREIEKYPSGYPLYASFLARDSEFQHFRRFRTTRMRMLLLKQDVISQLEEQLDKIDQDEEAELFLGSCRMDQNLARKDTIKALDMAFSEYDEFLQRSHWVLSLPDPTHKHVQSTENWLETSGCMARSETKYFRAEPFDLLSIGRVKDQSMSEIGHVIERIAIFLCVMKRRVFSKKPDPWINNIVLSKPFIRIFARVLTATLAITLLLAPIVALNAVRETLERFVIVFAAATCFVTLIVLASKASIVEIFAAGAAYSAVLVVFVSGNGLEPQMGSK